MVRVPRRFVASVRAAPGYRFYSTADIHDLLLFVDFSEQGGLEVDKSHIENQLRAIQRRNLPRRRFIGLRARTGRYQYVDSEVVARDAAYDFFQRCNRYI